MLNDDGPRFKRSKLELRIQRDTIYCGILLFILCTAGAVGQSVWLNYMSTIPNVPYLSGLTDQYDSGAQGAITFFSYVIYLQNLIPLPLFVSQELVKMLQVYLMQNDLDLYHEPTKRRLACRSWNLSEDLGQIQYVFTDKTGTLTENVMTFRRCVVSGIDHCFGNQGPGAAKVRRKK
jgi:phospholipid-translocating ATPase